MWLFTDHAFAAYFLNLALKDANAPNAPFDRRSLRRPGFYFVQCDAGHPWMSAYIWIVEHPYYVKTDAKGNFELTDVPPGTYTLKFWHEGWEAEPVEQDGKVVGFDYGAVRQHKAQVTVTSGQAAAVSWEIPG